jgi:hypothetical protein
MEATVYSYKMTFQTLTFRDDPRFQDGLYIMVITELADNTVSRIMYGPLTEDLINRFRKRYVQAALDMLKAAALLLPRVDAPDYNPWGIDTTGWTPKDKDLLNFWAGIRQPAFPDRPKGYFTHWEASDGKTGLYWRYSDSGGEYWHITRETVTSSWCWFCHDRPITRLLHEGESGFGTAQAAADACLQWHQAQGLALTDNPT